MILEQCKHHNNCGSIKDCCGTFNLPDCTREVTTQELIAELENKRPNCKQCENWSVSEIQKECQECIWNDLKDNFKEKK